MNQHEFPGLESLPRADHGAKVGLGRLDLRLHPRSEPILQHDLEPVHGRGAVA